MGDKLSDGEWKAGWSEGSQQELDVVRNSPEVATLRFASVVRSLLDLPVIFAVLQDENPPQRGKGGSGNIHNYFKAYS